LFIPNVVLADEGGYYCTVTVTTHVGKVYTLSATAYLQQISKQVALNSPHK